MDIAIPIYDRFTALDAVGPYNVLAAMPGARVTFIAAERGIVRCEDGMAAMVADRSFDELPEPQVFVVPGGYGSRALLDDERTLDWIRHAHAHSDWTTSVCTGSLLLGAAGVLDGLEATGHWLELEPLAGYGATPTSRRVVEQGKVITAAGVSSGIDMALLLVARIMGDEAAEAIQLAIEYDPQPPFDSGSPAKARPETVARVRQAMRAAQAEMSAH